MSQIARPQAAVARQTITAAKYFFHINLGSHLVSGIQCRWFDGTIDANGSTKFYLSCMENPTIPATAGTPAATEWDEDTTITFTGPAGSAAGNEVIHLGNNGAKHLLIEITFTAVGDIEWWAHGKD